MNFNNNNVLIIWMITNLKSQALTKILMIYPNYSVSKIIICAIKKVTQSCKRNYNHFKATKN